MASDPNSWSPGDDTNNILRKLLNRFGQFITQGISLDVSDVEIGAVEIKDAITDNRVAVINTPPAGNEYALVVRPVGGGSSGGTVDQGNPGLFAWPVTGPLTDAQLRATPVPVSGTFFQATQPVSGTFFQATQPVSGTVAVSTSFLLDATFTGRINTQGQKAMTASTPVVLASDQSAIPVTGTFFQATQPVSIAATVAVSGPLTDAQLRATPVPVSGTVTTTPPSNASVNLTQLAGTAVDVNSGAKSNGTLRIVLATDQPQLTASLKVDGSGVTQPVSGTVAVTNANLDVALSTLATQGTLSALNGKVPSQGAAVTAASTPVNIASDQTVNVSNTPVQNNGKTINRFVLAQGGAGTTQIAAADATKKHKIVGAVFTLGANGTAKFTATADLTGPMDIAQYGGFVIPPNASFPWVETPVNQALSIVTTGGAANGVILYITET